MSKLQATELVTLLDRVWSKFDELSEKHGVQKMETVGATYMAVGGLNEVSDCQPVAITEMALGCIDEVLALCEPDGTPLRLRVGLHSGEVLSGVVGTRYAAASSERRGI